MYISKEIDICAQYIYIYIYIYIYMYTALKWSSFDLFWQFYQILFLCLKIH